MSPLINHLWQSTLFTGAVALLALAFRANRAQARYWLWSAASFKFLLPISLLMGAGAKLAYQPATRITTERPVAAAITQVSDVLLPLTDASPSTPWLAYVLGGIWIAGFCAIILIWCRRWLLLDAARRAATPLDIAASVPILSTPAMLEPGVFGIWRPVLLLPRGIESTLTPEQLDAIVAHEMCHIERRDNLLGLAHMVVQAIFWFHPALWYIAVRLNEERERACDEEVVHRGNRPEAYAAGILNVCRFYLQSPLPCAPGVTGADLKQRVREIMTRRAGSRLTATRKVMLACAVAVAISVPFTVGIVQAQGQLSFDTASIRPSEPGQQNSRFNIVPGGGLNVSNVPVRNMIEIAYGVRSSQVMGGPSWLESSRYDIIARMDKADGPSDFASMSDADRNANEQRLQQRTRALLEDRFKLVVRRETREMPLLALTVAKGGLKMKPLPQDDKRPPNIRMNRGSLTAQRAPLSRFAQSLSHLVGQTVVDQTGIAGEFDFAMKWSPDNAPDADGPSIYTAIQDQLGLRLESKKGPVEVIVIESIEKPTEN
ncbi:MAG: TIGR03435 family protein [Acidobacteria bacterium]|nr:TIGR03435 family protein [Acidobacteriota bacterium]